MIIYLPSNGMMGPFSVDMREPTIAILKKSRNYSQYNLIRKYEFVRDLTSPKEAGSMTVFDLDYVFIIGVAALTMNMIAYSIKCACGRRLKEELNVGERLPLRLPRGIPKTVTKVVSDKELTFTKLSVDDFIKVEEYALDLPDEDYIDNRDDAVVAMTLFNSLDKAVMDNINNLTLAQYYQAIAYQGYHIHGIDLTSEVVCPECGHKSLVSFPINGDLLEFDVTEMLASHVRMANFVTYQDFMDFTLVDYNQYVQSLNQHFQQQEQQMRQG